MTTLPEATTALAGAYGRGVVLRALEDELILRNIIVGTDGRIGVQTQEWPEYWRPVCEAGSSQVLSSLSALREAWSAYIHSGFDRTRQREYCLRYFLLLDLLVKESVSCPAGKARTHSLHTVLGFECAGVSTVNSPGQPIAAATSTFRNPCYLLAKLRSPDVVDDSGFLPLVVAAGAGRSELFYHYRQHRLAMDSEHSILTYLSTSQDRRIESFRVLNAIEHTLGEGLDPRAAERAKRIAGRILIPYLSAHASGGEALDVELVDVGAGSGLLASKLCQSIHQFLAEQGIPHKLRVWMVDLVPPRPARFFSRGALRRATDSLASIGIEYRDWLADARPLPAPRGIRIGIASYLFNNLSDFAVIPVAPETIASGLPAVADRAAWADCQPSICLLPDKRGPQSLVRTSRRIRLEAGHVYVQPSLSRFYQGLSMLSRPAGVEGESPAEGHRLFLPLRSFRSESLRASDGGNVLRKLLDECSIVVVEDADLAPRDLALHGRTALLPDSVAVDMTRALRLKKRYSYVFLHSTDKAVESLAGKRLW